MLDTFFDNLQLPSISIVSTLTTLDCRIAPVFDVFLLQRART